MTPERAVEFLGPYAETVTPLHATTSTLDPTGAWIIEGRIGDNTIPLAKTPSAFTATRWMRDYETLTR